MPITPDTKDWTWVLEWRCDDCGFDSSSWPAAAIAPAVRENAAADGVAAVNAQLSEMLTPEELSTFRAGHITLIDFKERSEEAARGHHPD